MRNGKINAKGQWEDLENIWHYGWQHFGEIESIDILLIIYQKYSALRVPTTLARPRPELGEYIYALPFERHIIYFIISYGSWS